MRDKTLWRLLYDSAARAYEILGLDVDDLDLPDKTATVTGKGGITRQVNWYTHTAHLLPRLVDGRTHGPLLLANRRPRSPVATVDLDPATGRARLSYRRAAEVFTSATGWTLHQLRHTRIRELKDTGCPLPVLQKITDTGRCEPDRALPRTQPPSRPSLVRQHRPRRPPPPPRLSRLPRFFPLSYRA